MSVGARRCAVRGGLTHLVCVRSGQIVQTAVSAVRGARWPTGADEWFAIALHCVCSVNNVQVALPAIRTVTVDVMADLIISRISSALAAAVGAA